MVLSPHWHVPEKAEHYLLSSHPKMPAVDTAFNSCCSRQSSTAGRAPALSQLGYLRLGCASCPSWWPGCWGGGCGCGGCCCSCDWKEEIREYREVQQKSFLIYMPGRSQQRKNFYRVCFQQRCFHMLPSPGNRRIWAPNFLSAPSVCVSSLLSLL